MSSVNLLRERLESWTERRSGAAVGAIGTCIAALVAVLALLGIPFRTKSIKLEGQWKGELGDEWDFVALLKVERDKIKGRIHWTLVECPPALPWGGQGRLGRL